MVLRTAPGSSAEKAGLRGVTLYPDGSFDPGDIIIAVEGKPVHSPKDIDDILQRYEVGDTVTVEISRNGRLIKKRLILEPAYEDDG